MLRSGQPVASMPGIAAPPRRHATWVAQIPATRVAMASRFWSKNRMAVSGYGAAFLRRQSLLVVAVDAGFMAQPSAAPAFSPVVNGRRQIMRVFAAFPVRPRPVADGKHPAKVPAATPICPKPMVQAVPGS
jgi:hypothetical protein